MRSTCRCSSCLRYHRYHVVTSAFSSPEEGSQLFPSPTDFDETSICTMSDHKKLLIVFSVRDSSYDHFGRWDKIKREDMTSLIR